jgi:hypothetical protein
LFFLARKGVDRHLYITVDAIVPGRPPERTSRAIGI